MSATKQESILRRDPYRDRRSFVARAMALSSIGDIAGATLSENTATGALTWETETDWDNSISENGVVHEQPSNTDFPAPDVIQLGYPTFDRGGSSLEAYWALDEDSGGTTNDISGNNRDGSIDGGTLGVTGFHGSTTYDYDPTPSTEDGITVSDSTLAKSDSEPFSWFFWLLWDGGDSGRNNRCIGTDTTAGIGCLKDGGFVDGGNDLILRYNSTEQSFGTNMSTNVWYSVGVTYDGSGTLTWYWDGSQIGSTSASWSQSESAFGLYSVIRDGSPSGESWPGKMEYVRAYGRELSSTEISNHHNAGTAGHLETATKSFASPIKPNFQNLSYSLNGQTIDLKAIGSPGTTDEEVVTQTLDGAASYSLTWSNSHTDFRLRPEISTSDVTTTPTFSKGELA